MESPDNDASPRATSETSSPNGAQTPNDSKEKKPFTYTPGGLDLSEIKSETMARRLLKNAMSPGVQEVPKQANRSGSLPSGPPLHSYNLVSVPVLPNVQLPANPKSLLRQTSGPNNITDPIDRIMDSSIPFEITNGKKLNGSITEGTPIVKNGNSKENEENDTKSINQTIRRNSEKLESSVEEVIEKLKQSLEEANKNLERVNIETNKKTSESFEEVSEEEFEEEEEDEEQAESENEDEVIEQVTIIRKTKTTTKNVADNIEDASENNSTQEGLKILTNKADDDIADENSNIKCIKTEELEEEEEEIEEEEEEEEVEETEETEETETTEKITTKTNVINNEKENEEQVDKKKESEDEGNETDYSDNEDIGEKIEVVKEDIKETGSLESVAKNSNKSVSAEVEENNIEKSDTGSNRSSKRNSVDEHIKNEVEENTQNEMKTNENLEKTTEDTEVESIKEVETVETVDIITTTKTTDTSEDITNRQRPLSPQKRIYEGLGDIEKLPSLDISSKRFSFLRENEERQHEVYVHTPHNYPQSRQRRSTSPGYKTSQYQAPAFERPIQKSYHPPPPSVVNKSYPPAQTYLHNQQIQPNIQGQSQYHSLQIQNDYQPIPIQYYTPATAQYQTPQYNQTSQVQPQRAQEYQNYPQTEVIPPQNRSIEYPYYHETILSQNQKQVEILPPWKTEEMSQKQSNYGYENKSSFYGISPISKTEAPWKSAYVPPVASTHVTKPVSGSTTSVLNPLLPANKRHSWLQQTSIEQEFSDPSYEPEPIWKRELREMATKPNDYYTDELEQKVEVEPPWRRELREYSQRNNPQPDEPKLESQASEPPWMKEVKYRLTTYNQPQTPSNWQSQTLRPKTWREKSVDLERMRAQEVPEWQKPNNFNRPRPVSSYAKGHLEPNYLDPRTRGVSVDRERVPRPYQSPVNPINSTTSSYSNGYSLPWEVSSNESPMLSPTPLHYDRTPTPQSSSSPYRQQQKQSYGYTPSPTSSKREYATLSYQPRNRISNRTCPVQSRSFRYLQILTGTHDGYVDDEPFVAQSPLQGQTRPGHY